MTATAAEAILEALKTLTPEEAQRCQMVYLTETAHNHLMFLYGDRDYDHARRLAYAKHLFVSRRIAG